jgi:hypothetical protein
MMLLSRQLLTFADRKVISTFYINMERKVVFCFHASTLNEKALDRSLEQCLRIRKRNAKLPLTVYVFGDKTTCIPTWLRDKVCEGEKSPLIIQSISDTLEEADAAMVTYYDNHRLTHLCLLCGSKDYFLANYVLRMTGFDMDSMQVVPQEIATDSYDPEAEDLASKLETDTKL